MLIYNRVHRMDHFHIDPDNKFRHRQNSNQTRRKLCIEISKKNNLSWNKNCKFHFKNPWLLYYRALDRSGIILINKNMAHSKIDHHNRIYRLQVQVHDLGNHQQHSHQKRHRRRPNHHQLNLPIHMQHLCRECHLNLFGVHLFFLVSHKFGIHVVGKGSWKK